MSEYASDSLEAQNSDSDFEKVPYPGEEMCDDRTQAAVADDFVKMQQRRQRTPHPMTDEGGDKKEFQPEDVCTVTRTSKGMLEANVTNVEQSESKCFWETALDPRVQDLIYWRDVRKTVLVFAVSLLVCMSMMFFSLICVVAYLSLFALTFTFSYRLCGNIVALLKKRKDLHPFHKHLVSEISFPVESVYAFSDQLVANVSRLLDALRRLFLVDSFLDSVKFGLLLWLLTFVSSWFSGASLFILGDVILFTVPKIHRHYQKEIDECLKSANARLEKFSKTILEKVQRNRKTD